MRNSSTDLRANSSADGDADSWQPNDVVQQEVRDNAEDSRAGQNKVGGRCGDMYGEAQQINHKGHMDDAAADAEDAGDKANSKAGGNANPLIELEAGGKIHDIRRWFVHGVPEHDAGHAEHEEAIVEIQLRCAEFIYDIGADKSPRQGGQGEGNRRAEKDAFLADVGNSARYGIGEHYDQRSAGNLCCRMEVGIEPPVRHKEDKDWHTDESAADSDQCAKGADKKSQQQEKNNSHDNPFSVKRDKQTISV